MFKKIIDKIEQATINYTIKHRKPFTYYLNRPDGKCCKTRHTSFNAQSKYFYDDKGREIAWIYSNNGKITSCTTYEYKNNESNEQSKRWKREFKIVDNKRVLIEDSLVVYNDDGTYTVTENGITTTKHIIKPTVIKDNNGNIIEEKSFDPDENEDFHAVMSYDEQNRLIRKVTTYTVNNVIKNKYIDENAYDAEGHLIKHTWYMNTDYGTDESTTIDYNVYDEKSRLVKCCSHTSYDRACLGKRKYIDTTYYKYDEKNNATITLHEYSNWASKCYDKTVTLPNGYTVESHWDLPVWPDKLRRFFGAY